MERVGGEFDSGKLRVRDFNPLRIFIFGQFSADAEASVGCGCCNKLDNSPVTPQRLSPPIHRNEREQTMLDLVPLARAGWQMANRDWNLELVGELLELHFP